jgi:hypothetical protein
LLTEVSTIRRGIPKWGIAAAPGKNEKGRTAAAGHGPADSARSPTTFGAAPFPPPASVRCGFAGAKSPARATCANRGRGVNCHSATSHYRKLSRFPRNGSRELMLAYDTVNIAPSIPAFAGTRGVSCNFRTNNLRSFRDGALAPDPESRRGHSHCFWIPGSHFSAPRNDKLKSAPISPRP